MRYISIFITIATKEMIPPRRISQRNTVIEYIPILVRISSKHALPSKTPINNRNSIIYGIPLVTASTINISLPRKNSSTGIYGIPNSIPLFTGAA